METTKTYFGSGSLMEPDGWPAAFVPKKYEVGCNQPITRKGKDRRKRLDEYRKLVEQGRPTPDNYLEGQING